MSDENGDSKLHHLGAGLMNAKATLEGEAAELAHRRPHSDAHLYDVEEGLRHAAGEAEDLLTRWYYER